MRYGPCVTQRCKFGIFDRRVLLPLEQLVSSVQAETGEQVSLDDLRRMADAGLNPTRRRRGATLRPVSGWSLTSTRTTGYSATELRDIVEHEDATIDEFSDYGSARVHRR